MFIAFGGLLAVFWSVQHVAQLQNAQSETAATMDLPDTKEQLLRPSTRVRHTDKVRGPLSSEITLIGSTSGTAGTALVLQATVTATKEVTGAKLKWLLPTEILPTLQV